MTSLEAHLSDDTERTLTSLAAVLTLLLVFGMAARFSPGADTWWHLRAGQWIWTHKALPWVDPFSYTHAGAPWHYPGWPMELMMYGLARWGGLGWLNLWTAALVTAAFAAVWATAEGHPLIKAAFVLLGATTAAVHWTARPYLLTVVLAALFLWLLHRWQIGHRRDLWWLPPLMVLWVNGHGGYILGVILWGVYFVGALVRCGRARLQPQAESPCRALWTLGGVGVALVLAILVNPYGAEMLRYPFYTLHMEATKSFIAEWRSPDFHLLSFWPLLLMIVLLVMGAGWTRPRWTLEEGLLAAGGLYLTLNWMRNVDVFVVMVTPVLVRSWDGILREVVAWLPRRASTSSPRPHRYLNLALVALVALGVLGKAGVMALPQVNAALVAREYPTKAVDYLRTHRPPGHLYNDYNWGGYLTWVLPDYPVFIDGRADLYGDDFIQQWLRVMEAQSGWEAVLDYWNVRLVLIRADAPLVKALPTRGWHLLYHDDKAVLYGR